jgi:hypothetical protein
MATIAPFAPGTCMNGELVPAPDVVGSGGGTCMGMGGTDDPAAPTGVGTAAVGAGGDWIARTAAGGDGVAGSVSDSTR